ISQKMSPAGHLSADQEESSVDPKLAGQLAGLFQGKRVCDFSRSVGYAHWLRRGGIDCDYVNENLEQSFRFKEQYDAVICLDGPADIPKQDRAILLDKLISHSKEMIVLSWAVPRSGSGDDVNCRMDFYLIYQLWKRGIWLRSAATRQLRD